MTASRYVAPVIEEIGSFQEITNGLWFGKYTDIFGGRAVVRIIIET